MSNNVRIKQTRDAALRGMTIDQIAVAARKVGMSYGKYVAYVHEYGELPEQKP